MARDVRALTRAERLGEEVTVHFKAGGERTFLAAVTRLQLEPLGKNSEFGAAVRAAEVLLPYSDTDGVTAIADGDEITCVLVLGAPAVRCRIHEVLSADEGGFNIRAYK